MNKVVFCALALVAMAVHMFVFSFRYLWYLEPNEYTFVIVGYVLCMVSIVALWALRPSPVAVGMVSVLALIFPPILRPEVFVGVDLVYGAYILAAVAALIGVTYYRRRKMARTISDR